MTVTYHVGDSRAVIAGIPDGSVDLIASSPPFLALRSYLPAGHEAKGDEIGSEANPAAFLDTLLELTAEWGRVLAPHGSLAIELGDTYTGARGYGSIDSPNPAYAHAPKHEGHFDGRTAKNFKREDDGWPLAKSLALIPQLYAVALAYGINPLTGQASPAGRFRVRNVIVWHRPNPAVGALGDKVRPSTSYIVVATRSAKRWFDLTAVRTAYGGNGLPPERKQNAALLASFSKGNTWDGEKMMQSNPAGAPPLDAWFDEYDYHDTWTLTTQPSSLAHYAMWPAKLAERLILMMCPREVCRVCGEPRRRIEGVAEYVKPNGSAHRFNGDRPSSIFGDESERYLAGRRQPVTNADNGNMSATRPTLGWTDCGCNCPTCGGDGRIDRSITPHYTPNYMECPDCTDGRAFRPGLVLDPFAGTGTTLAVADLHGRDAIGIDINEANKELYPARYAEVSRALFGTQPELPGQLGFFDEVPA